MKIRSFYIYLTFLYAVVFVSHLEYVADAASTSCTDLSSDCNNTHVLSIICGDTATSKFCEKSCGLCQHSTPLQIVFTDQSEVIQYGSEVRFQCVVSGGHNVTVNWRTTDGPLPSNAVTQHGGQTLVIPVFQPQDNKDYICIASDDSSTVQSVFHIPKFTTSSLPLNELTTTVPHASQGSRLMCLSCNDVVQPGDCTHVTLCGTDEKCSTQELMINGQRRFKLGCLRSSTCHTLEVLNGFGKRNKIRRQIEAVHYCQQCCDKENCNKDLCGASSHELVTTTGSHVTTQFAGCVDLPQCVQYKDFFCDPSHPEGHAVCPVSCGTCGKTLTSTLTTSPVPRTTTATSGCVDGAHCAKYADFFCSASNPEGQKLCPVTCGVC